jgi:dolichol-phosphate mannosyltransferase
MRPVQRVLIGLPAFNEEVADRTADVALAWQDKLPVVLLGTEKNRGLGAGLGTLVQYACAHGQPDDVLVIMDCDDTHNPVQIPSMLARIEAGSDLVIASRFRHGAATVGVPRLRRLTAFGAMMLLKAIHPMAGVLDYTCGYRAYRVSLLQLGVRQFGSSLVSEPGFSCMVELLLKLNLSRPRASEVPLILRYDLKPSASKMNVGNQIVSLLRLMVIWRLKGFNAYVTK